MYRALLSPLSAPILALTSQLEEADCKESRLSTSRDHNIFVQRPPQCWCSQWAVRRPLSSIRTLAHTFWLYFVPVISQALPNQNWKGESPKSKTLPRQHRSKSSRPAAWRIYLGLCFCFSALVHSTFPPHLLLNEWEVPNQGPCQWRPRVLENVHLK